MKRRSVVAVGTLIAAIVAALLARERLWDNWLNLRRGEGRLEYFNYETDQPDHFQTDEHLVRFGKDAGKKHGPYRVRNGSTVEFVGRYHYGEKDGIWTFYLEDGRVLKQERWARGKYVTQKDHPQYLNNPPDLRSVVVEDATCYPCQVGDHRRCQVTVYRASRPYSCSCAHSQSD